jgi:peptide/nickel transport system permease protein
VDDSPLGPREYEPQPQAILADAALAPTAVALYQYAVVPYGNSTALNGTPVLDASGSTGSGTLTYTWTFNDGAERTLGGMQPFYRWIFVGTWTVTLNVTERGGAWDTETVIVRVIPKAEAGTNRVISVHDTANLTVRLNASRSASSYNITEYRWSFNYSGEQQILYGVESAFTFAKPGSYTVLLRVTDEGGNVAYDNVTVKIRRLPYFYEEHWALLFVGLPLMAIASVLLISKWRTDGSLVTSTDIDKMKLRLKRLKKMWTLFKSNRMGMVGFTFLLVFVGLALLAPVLSLVPGSPLSLEARDVPEGGLWENPHPPTLERLPGMNYTHIFGTDYLGQDVWSMTIYGTRASLMVGVLATFISLCLGATTGLAAGYFGSKTDEVLMRATDFFLVLPWFPLMIVMMAILGRDFLWVIVVIGITSWPSTARIVRAQVLSIKERQFVERARCIGAGDGHIISTHVLPNVMPLIFANTVLLVALAIFSAAFLEFFGLGDPTIISWGTMLELAYAKGAFSSGAWWWILSPGMAIVLMVLSFSLTGYALDDVLNPKLRRR